MKSLEYALPAMTYTEDECNELTWPLLKQLLPKAGINRNMNREIVYATYNSQGLNVKNPYIIQGTSHITDLTEHLWKKTVTGHMMRVALEHLRIELGKNIDILRSNWNQHKNQLLTISWMTETWRFMSKIGVTLEDETQKFNS